MNITKLAQAEDDFVYAWVAVDEKGNKACFLEPGQKLGKKCDKLINDMAPGQGSVGHHDADYNSGGDGTRKAPQRDLVHTR